MPSGYIHYVQCIPLMTRPPPALRPPRERREPVASLARDLGVTRSTVDSRLERLTDSGTVVGFGVRIREDRDPNSIWAITLIEVEARVNTKVIHALRGFPEVKALHSTSKPP